MKTDKPQGSRGSGQPRGSECKPKVPRIEDQALRRSNDEAVCTAFDVRMAAPKSTRHSYMIQILSDPTVLLSVPSIIISAGLQVEGYRLMPTS